MRTSAKNRVGDPAAGQRHKQTNRLVEQETAREL
jgi:hypothetical protein